MSWNSWNNDGEGSRQISDTQVPPKWAERHLYLTQSTLSLEEVGKSANMTGEQRMLYKSTWRNNGSGWYPFERKQHSSSFANEQRKGSRHNVFMCYAGFAHKSSVVCHTIRGKKRVSIHRNDNIVREQNDDTDWSTVHAEEQQQNGDRGDHNENWKSGPQNIGVNQNQHEHGMASQSLDECTKSADGPNEETTRKEDDDDFQFDKTATKSKSNVTQGNLPRSPRTPSSCKSKRKKTRHIENLSLQAGYRLVHKPKEYCVSHKPKGHYLCFKPDRYYLEPLRSTNIVPDLKIIESESSGGKKAKSRSPDKLKSVPDQIRVIVSDADKSKRTVSQSGSSRADELSLGEISSFCPVM